MMAVVQMAFIGEVCQKENKLHLLVDVLLIKMKSQSGAMSFQVRKLVKLLTKGGDVRKLKLLLLLVVLLLIPSLAQAQQSLLTTNVNVAILKSFACEGTNCAGLTIDATAGGTALTSAQYNPSTADNPSGFSRAQRADCYNVGAKIWVTSLSTITLSTGKGMAVLDGGYFTIYGYTDISTFKAIRDAAVSSVLYCTYSRVP